MVGESSLRLRQGQARGRRGLAPLMAFSQELIPPGFAHSPVCTFLHLPLPLVVFEYKCETKLLPKESIYSVF